MSDQESFNQTIKNVGSIINDIIDGGERQTTEVENLYKRIKHKTLSARDVADYRECTENIVTNPKSLSHGAYVWWKLIHPTVDEWRGAKLYFMDIDDALEAYDTESNK